MPPASQCEHRAEDAKPKEEDGVDLIAPDKRLMKEVAEHDAGEEQSAFHEQQDDRADGDDPVEPAPECVDQIDRAGRMGEGAGGHAAHDATFMT